MDNNLASVAVDAVAATATLAAVVAAFVVQGRQARADRNLQEAARNRVLFCAADAGRDALGVVHRAGQWASGIGAGDVYGQLQKLKWESELLEYYLGRDITDLTLVRDLISVREIVSDARADLAEILKQSLDFELQERTRFAAVVASKAEAIGALLISLSAAAVRFSVGAAKAKMVV